MIEYVKEGDEFKENPAGNIRKHYGLTYKQVANHLGLSTTRIQQICHQENWAVRGPLSRPHARQQNKIITAMLELVKLKENE